MYENVVKQSFINLNNTEAEQLSVAIFVFLFVYELKVADWRWQ